MRAVVAVLFLVAVAAVQGATAKDYVFAPATHVKAGAYPHWAHHVRRPP